MNDREFDLVVSAEQARQRLDKWLGEDPRVGSRSRAAELIQAGRVRVAGTQVKASIKLPAGMRVHVQLPEPIASELEPLDRPLEVLHEDEDLIVVNKPAGLVVHPAAGHAQDTLVNILLHHVSKNGGQLAMGFAENRPGIVHRLDRDTSGVLVVAKNDHAHHALAQQFREKTAHRIYWAITQGRPHIGKHGGVQGTIRTHLARHPRDRKRFASHTGGLGKHAITHWRVLEARPNGTTWMQCQLETGRTHQIRVHLSEAGAAILGDTLYGARATALPREAREQVAAMHRVALHACELGFVHPRTAKDLNFHVGWPQELRRLAESLGFRDV